MNKFIVKFPNRNILKLFESFIQENYDINFSANHYGYNDSDVIYLYYKFFSGRPFTHSNQEYFLSNKDHFQYEISLSDFLNVNIVELNNKYIAIISKNKITVGCQEFSFEKLEELYYKAKSLR